ncbi:MAG: hypothetical protein PHS59_09090 [Paludibacter sp.]|nr:hypothetical protein [Paludibacter sp.]
MKTIKFFALIATIAFLSVSCVENSNKFKSMVAERDSIAIAKQALDSNYTQTLALMNDIEAGFAVINQNESQMQLNLKGVEGKSMDKRQMIAAQMTAIKETMEQNRSKIAELQRLNAKTGKSNVMLTETINRLNKEMKEKNALIESLQNELNQKNIKIDELTNTVADQSKNISNQQNVMEEQKSTIKMQDSNINSVWYVVATSKELKSAKIITNAGLFQPKKVLESDFDNHAFTKVDKRTTLSISTNSKKIKIFTIHPANSYELVKGEDNLITIKITNTANFWSVSKYLIVQI